MKPGHILLLLIILGWTLWYLLDALRVSWNLRNIILIVPLAGIILAAALFELARQAALGMGWLRPPAEAAVPAGPGAEQPQSRGDLARGVVLLGMLGLLVFSMARIGFDAAIFLFLFSALLLLEPRRILAKLVFAVVFTVIVVRGARLMLPFPMPTLLL
jgi:putative tricarboxylic transport membrane protein